VYVCVYVMGFVCVVCVVGGFIWLTWTVYTSFIGAMYGCMYVYVMMCMCCRRVYLAYLDSVHFFHPKVFRTAVYHEMLIGYLDYVKNVGSVILSLLHGVDDTLCSLIERSITNMFIVSLIA